MKSSCYLFSWHKLRKNVKWIKTVGKYWTFNLTKYVNVCFLVEFYFLLWNTENNKLPVQWCQIGNLYIGCPVGKGLWSIRALLHSVLNKTLTLYLGSNSTINSLRISQLTWNLSWGYWLTNSYTNSPSDSATDGLQSKNKSSRQEQFRKFFPVFPMLHTTCLRTSFLIGPRAVNWPISEKLGNIMDNICIHSFKKI